MQCPSCGAQLPDDASFCIECGADLRRQASTGATVALPRIAEGTAICPACGAANPSYALFCVRCGQRMDATTATTSRPLPPVIDLEPPQTLAYGPTYKPRRRGMSPWFPIFLVGMGLLFLLRMPIWPFILPVIGLATFVNETVRGRLLSGMQSAFWMFGLAIIFSPGFGPRLFVPGMIVLVGGSILLGLIAKATRNP